MIPHHQNAVNMAKALLKNGEIDCPDITDQESPDCIMLKMMYDIINGQNHQIQLMRQVLVMKGYPAEDDCSVAVSPLSGYASTGRASSKENAVSSGYHVFHGAVPSAAALFGSVFVMMLL